MIQIGSNRFYYQDLHCAHRLGEACGNHFLEDGRKYIKKKFKNVNFKKTEKKMSDVPDLKKDPWPQGVWPLDGTRRIQYPRSKKRAAKRSLQLLHVMVIDNAPFLERLLVSDLEGPTKIRVIDAPKLTALVHSSAKFSELFI